MNLIKLDPEILSNAQSCFTDAKPIRGYIDRLLHVSRSIA